MAEKLTIRERVERQVVANLEAIETGLEVQRFDVRATGETNGLIFVYAAEENADEGGMGPPLTDHQLQVEVLRVNAPGHAVSESSSQVNNRWLGKIQDAMLSDPRLTEDGTGETLAVDVKYQSTREYFLDDRPLTHLVAVFQVHYVTHRDDPYQGPGITERIV